MSTKLVYFRDGSGKLRATWINKGKTYPYSSERQNTREKRKRERQDAFRAEFFEYMRLNYLPKTNEYHSEISNEPR